MSPWIKPFVLLLSSLSYKVIIYNFNWEYNMKKHSAPPSQVKQHIPRMNE